MAEDIITDLSKLSQLFVIARNTTFQFKGKAVDLIELGRKLKVKYVLEGSVRRVGDTVRINVQLIDAAAGGHLWAERYDGELSDVFALQDQMTKKIVSSLALALDATTKRVLSVKGTDNPAAYDTFLRGLRHLNVRLRGNIDSILKAREEFEKAVGLDPDFARAYAGLGLTYWNQYAYFDHSNDETKRRAIELAERSLSLQQNALALRLIARQYFFPDAYLITILGKRHDLAIAELRKAITLEPNNADALAELAYVLAFAGEAQEAIELAKRALQLNPNFPPWYHRPTGIAYFLNSDYAAALPQFRAWAANDSAQIDPKLWLAAAQALAGRTSEASATVDDINRLRRGFQLYATGASRFWSFAKEQDRLHFRDGLIKAGLPSGDE